MAVILKQAVPEQIALQGWKPWLLGWSITFFNLEATFAVHTNTATRKRQNAAPLSANVGIASAAVSQVYVLSPRQPEDWRNAQPNASIDGNSVNPRPAKDK